MIVIKNDPSKMKNIDINSAAYERYKKLQEGHKRARERYIKLIEERKQLIKKVLKHRKAIELEINSKPKEEQDEFILELLKIPNDKLKIFYESIDENLYIL